MGTLDALRNPRLFISLLVNRTFLNTRRQNCAPLARVVRAAGKGAADEIAPSHSVYADPKNPPQFNVAWIPGAEAPVD